MAAFYSAIGLGVAGAERAVGAVGLFYGLPFLGISALSAVAGLGAGPLVWGAFLLAYIVGVRGGYLVQRKWLLGREGRRVRLAGESLTLSMMMLVFGASFVGGFLQSAAPAVYDSVWFGVIFAAVLGVSSGSFTGRAVRVWKGV